MVKSLDVCCLRPFCPCFSQQNMRIDLLSKQWDIFPIQQNCISSPMSSPTFWLTGILIIIIDNHNSNNDIIPHIVILLITIIIVSMILFPIVDNSYLLLNPHIDRWHTSSTSAEFAAQLQNLGPSGEVHQGAAPVTVKAENSLRWTETPMSRLESYGLKYGLEIWVKLYG